MLRGQFPDLKTASEMLSSGWHSVAIHRYFALEKDEFRGDFILRYKGEKVGFGSTSFSLAEDYKFVRELLIQSGLEIQ